MCSMAAFTAAQASRGGRDLRPWSPKHYYLALCVFRPLLWKRGHSCTFSHQSGSFLKKRSAVGQSTWAWWRGSRAGRLGPEERPRSFGKAQMLRTFKTGVENGVPFTGRGKSDRRAEQDGVHRARRGPSPTHPPTLRLGGAVLCRHQVVAGPKESKAYTPTCLCTMPPQGHA